MLPVFFLLVFGLAAGMQVFATVRQTTRRRDERFRTALNRHERVSIIDLSAPNDISNPEAGDKASLPSRIFGFDQARLDLYPASPKIVIAAALLVALIIAGIATLMLGRLALVAALPLWPVVARQLFARWHRGRKRILFEQFPDALSMVVRGVRVGIPIGEAIASVARESEAPTAQEFERVHKQLQIGLPIEEALRKMAERNDLAEYRFFATALGLQGQTGGNLSETLEGLADVIRKRIAARDRGFALAAEARTSANILAALPVLMFGLLWVMNPHYIMTLLTAQTGHMILGATITLLGMGIMVMRFMIQKSLS